MGQPTYKITYSSKVSDACKTVLESIADFVDSDGLMSKAIPAGSLNGSADASALFERIALHFRLSGSEDPRAQNALLWAAEFLSMAVQRRCLLPEDVAPLVAIPVQFPRLFRDLFGARLPCAMPVDIGQHAAVAAAFIDLILFLLELHEPRVDRLRKERFRLDADAMSWARDAYRAGRGASPEPLIATLAWEKRLRESRAFRDDSRSVIAWMRRQFGQAAPYWLFSLATRIHDAPFVLAAFDEHSRYDASATASVSAALGSRKTRYYVASRAGGTDLREAENFLLFFCRKYNVEFVGTPFYSPALDSELHVLAQQVVVTHRHNAVEVVIPAFYTGNHLEKNLDGDFYDLKQAISHKLNVKPVNSVKKPDERVCPLSDKELVEAAKAVRKVLEQAHGMSPYRSFRCAELALSWWWPWRSEKRRGKKRKLERHAGPTDDDAKTRMTKWIVPPAPTPADLEREKRGYPARQAIVQSVDDALGKSTLTSTERYAWAKYYRQLLKRGFIVR